MKKALLQLFRQPTTPPPRASLSLPHREAGPPVNAVALERAAPLRPVAAAGHGATVLRLSGKIVKAVSARAAPGVVHAREGWGQRRPGVDRAGGLAGEGRDQNITIKQREGCGEWLGLGEGYGSRVGLRFPPRVYLQRADVYPLTRWNAVEFAACERDRSWLVSRP